MSECWDSDPDLDLPSGQFSLALHLSTQSDPETETESSSAGASALFSGNSEGVEWGDEDDDAGPVPRAANGGSGSGGGGGGGGTLKASSDGGAREGDLDEDDQGSSVDSSRNGTIRALLSSFSGLSLASPTKSTSPSSATDDSSSTTSAETTAPPKPHFSRPADKASTLRLSSSLSALLASASSGPGRVIHLGSTPQGQAKSVLGDWDEDLDLDNAELLHRPRLRGKSSFASHISDDPDDEFLEMSLPGPRTVRRPSVAPSAKSSTEPGDSDFDESDFELPSSLAQVTLSPLLLSHASMGSFSGLHSRNSSFATPTASTSTLLPPPSCLSTASPARSIGDTSAEEGDDDDEGFFEELVLPSYFLGGPGAMTPPSDGDGAPFGGGKIDLQAVLKRKLEARGREAEGREAQAKGKGPASRLDGFREGNEEEGVEHGLEIGDVKLGAERMRTRSGPQPPSLKVRNRTGSTVKRPPLPTSSGTSSRAASSSSTARNPTPTSPPKASTASRSIPTPRPSSLSRSGTTNPSPVAAGLGLGRPPRPASAAGAVERVNPRERRAAGPPPAPSTAARDRVRARTTSLRPAQSVANMTDLTTPTQKRFAPRIDTSATSITLSPVPSPTPMTPSLPAPHRGLRTKQSQGKLLATPNSSRTLQRKRSLQNISALSLESPFIPRRPLRSPTPGASLPSTPVLPPSQQTPRSTTRSSSSFAMPTAASSSRVRERVISGPSAVTPSASGSFLRQQQQPPRPSSAAAGRLTKPTLASKAKSRAASATFPTPPLTISRPKKARQYGDGTELDGFDDLPTSREREKMTPVRRSTGGTVKSASGSPSKAAGAATPTPATTTVARRLVKRDLSSGSLSSMDESSSRRPGAAQRPVPSRGDSASTVRGSSSRAPPVSKRSKGEEGKKGEVGGVGSVGLASPGKKRRAPRQEPHLIRNLGPPAIKVHGEMVWNATQQRWEGNESVLRDFDRVLSTSTRPALITHLSQHSPARVGFPSFPSTTSPPASSLRSANVKVVGSMVFDPVRMSWYSISSEEDELDLSMGGEGEMADDEGDEDGWEKGENTRMLKNRASFVMSEGSRDGESDAGEEGGERRGVWTECLEGERRHREEMRPWTARGELVALRDDGEREWLWDIRRLIMDTRSP